MYYKIKEYCDVIPDFALYFKWAQIKKELFQFIYPRYYEDLLQIIALCILHYKTYEKIKNGLSHEMYNYVHYVMGIPPRKTKRIGYRKNKPDYNLKCDLCNKIKNEYMRKNIVPGKKICGACYSKIRWSNKKRRFENMHTVDLISNAIKNELDIFIPDKKDIEKGICCLTGIECMTLPKKDILSSNFTNIDILKAPDSDRIGVSATIALKYKWERYSCWFVDENKFMRWDKDIFRDFFLNGIKSKRWSIYITTSYKKHGALFTKVNTSYYGIWRFEQLDVDASNKKKNNSYYNRISKALIDHKIGRSIIETLDCPSWLIKKIGLDIWMTFYKWAKDKYQSPLYKLCCYLLPSQKELKENECDR